jgi:hypothetical protein
MSPPTPQAFGASPPPLPAKPTRPRWPVRPWLAVLLSLCLALFLADAVVSLVDDSLILIFDLHLLTWIRGLVFLLAMLMAIVVYGLMALTPLVPKRLFLPVALFNPVAGLVVVPCLIYFYGRIQEVACGISLCQVLLGLGVLSRIQGGIKVRWPLVGVDQLGARSFGWLNLFGFLLVNVCALLPAVAGYLVVCAALAVDHFSDGFVALRPRGLTVQVRKYVRNDGKTIELVPMSHVGEPSFYRELSRSFPTNAIILMEGVTDSKNLLTNKISYQRMATSLGLAEQQKEFKPRQGEWVRADVDVKEFATNTIEFLNLVMLVHSKRLTAGTVLQLMQYSPPPYFEEQLLGDLLRKRNRHLLEEIRVRLPQSESLIVPWGAAHMPGIAKGIQTFGFHLGETHEYVVIRFHSVWNRSNRRRQGKTTQEFGSEFDTLRICLPPS